MRRWTAIAAAALLAGCGGAPEEPAPAPPEAQARTSAQQLLAGAPRDLGGGVSITGAKAEGRVLVVALGGMTDWRPGYTDVQMAGNMKRAMCFQPGVDALLTSGGTIRLESRTTAGQNLPPLTIDRC